MNPIEGTIPKRDITYRRTGKTLDIQHTPCLFYAQALNCEIAEHRYIGPVSTLLIIEITGDRRTTDLPHLNIAKMDIFDHAAAHCIVLEPKRVP